MEGEARGNAVGVGNGNVWERKEGESAGTLVNGLAGVNEGHGVGELPLCLCLCLADYWRAPACRMDGRVP